MRSLGPFLLMAAAALSCSGPERETTSTEVPALPEELRTADPYARGYTDADFPRIQELAEGVFTYEQLRSAGDERFATVSMFVVTSEGVLVADGQGSVEETARMVEAIAGLTDQPITHVVISSDHGDHTAGNAAFPAGAEFFAHPTSEVNLARSAAQLNRARDAPAVVMPTELISDRKELSLGGREIHIRFLGRAHTGGDLVVYLPSEKILFMSEAYLYRVFPAMRSAYPSEWVAMIESAQALDVDVFVPGHGFVEDADVLDQELETFRLALEQVIDEATRLHGLGLNAEEAAEQADFGALEMWSLRASQATRAVAQVYRELNGELN